MNMKRERYINPFTDFGFGRIFGDESNKDIISDFLNELFGKVGVRIENIVSVRSEYLTSVKEVKPIFDIYCENEKKQKTVIEIQKEKHDFFRNRNTFYSSFPIRDRIIRKDRISEFKDVYMIGIMDFVFKDSYRNEILISETEIYDDRKLMFVCLHIPNFDKTEDELVTRFDKWLYVIRNFPKFGDCPQKLRDQIFEKLFEIADVERFNRKEMMAYEHSLRYYRDMKNCIDTAREDGEKAKALQIAEEMLRDSEPLAKISKYTGLSTEELEKVRTMI
jgi:predicted transposase/invertase (TIGR01784 family)